MKSGWRLGEEWRSWTEHESAVAPGVRYRIARMTFGKRLELARELREASRRLEYAEAGQTAADRLEAIVLSHEMDAIYLKWGLLGIEGLRIDGKEAEPESLRKLGPLALVEEILERIKAECGLSEDERKN